MECPFCHHDIAASWQLLSAHTDALGRVLPQFSVQLQTTVQRGETRQIVTVTIQWLQCQNTDCQEIIVQVTRLEQGKQAETWIALPQRPDIPPLHDLVTDPFRKDYLEAWRILNDSPRMSAVLSRHILADLLKTYAKIANYGLANRIDKFIVDTTHPSRLRDNLHYLREIADFSAHTQTDQDDKIIEVTLEEAQWTLKIVADLFDYFIIAPKKDAAMREDFDKKIEAAGRKRISKPKPTSAPDATQ